MHDIDALLSAVAREESREPFEFRFGGSTWRVPHLADLTIGQQEDLDRGDYRVLADIGRRVGDDGAEVADGGELYRLVRGLTSKQFARLIQVPWLAHAGVVQGE
jgi:hypothetical protein